MRDIVLLLAVMGALPFILRRPPIGILVWSWLAYMNAHRLTWGFAYSFPFAQVVGVTRLPLLQGQGPLSSHRPVTDASPIRVLDDADNTVCAEPGRGLARVGPRHEDTAHHIPDNSLDAE